MLLSLRNFGRCSKLDIIKALLSHEKPHMTDRELLNEMADITIKELDPAKEPKKFKTKEIGKSDVNLSSGSKTGEKEM
jgi:hypothetical protein